MIMISLSSTIISCSISAFVGFILAILVGRFRRSSVSTPAQQENGSPTSESPSKTEKQLKLLVESLYQLTSQVDTQVGEHSLRVSEITNSLEAPDEVGSSMVLAAGKLLVSANQKLQADLEEAKSEIQRQREQADVCMHESRTDALTNLANRRAFDLEIGRVFNQRRREGNPFSLLIVDIDHFKRINDQYGHMVGDQLLKGFSRCLANTLRDSDFVARYGGEEFVAILPKTPIQEAVKAAERVRSAVADSRFKVGDLEIQITASMGVKEVGPIESESELIERADAALYAAKKGGRNRCFFHDGTTCLHYVPVVKQEAAETESTGESARVPAESDSGSSVMPSKSSKKTVVAGTVEKQVPL